MKFVIFLASVALTLAANTSHQVNHMFTLVDANRDGIFSKAELGHVYQNFDLNGDHRVTMTEFYRAFCHADHRLCIVAGDLFKDLDADHTLMILESSLDHLYDLFDADGNDEVTKSEFHTFMVKELDKLKAAHNLN
ncbi:probable calcium-binding protein CML10 [Gigantopelta aegis]|uniref:probable calcium-binding protein CML10 n=1 Tax=Gigantopelta aegis TaxID=1735272 RepID=UPI001B888A00|nr:probable calcium-binding protein CML10 [Gigantopelta aegis]